MKDTSLVKQKIDALEGYLMVACFYGDHEKQLSLMNELSDLYRQHDETMDNLVTSYKTQEEDEEIS